MMNTVNTAGTRGSTNTPLNPINRADHSKRISWSKLMKHKLKALFSPRYRRQQELKAAVGSLVIHENQRNLIQKAKISHQQPENHAKPDLVESSGSTLTGAIDGGSARLVHSKSITADTPESEKASICLSTAIEEYGIDTAFTDSPLTLDTDITIHDVLECDSSSAHYSSDGHPTHSSVASLHFNDNEQSCLNTTVLTPIDPLLTDRTEMTMVQLGTTTNKAESVHDTAHVQAKEHQEQTIYSEKGCNHVSKESVWESESIFTLLSVESEDDIDLDYYTACYHPDKPLSTVFETHDTKTICSE